MAAARCMAFFNEVGVLKENGEDEAMKPYVDSARDLARHLQQATMWFMQNAMAKPDNAGAGATDYMHLFGWWRSATCGRDGRRRQCQAAEGERRSDGMNAKLVTARFFMERMLPETAAHLARI